MSCYFTPIKYKLKSHKLLAALISKLTVKLTVREITAD